MTVLTSNTFRSTRTIRKIIKAIIHEVTDERFRYTDYVSRETAFRINAMIEELAWRDYLMGGGSVEQKENDIMPKKTQPTVQYLNVPIPEHDMPTVWLAADNPALIQDQLTEMCDTGYKLRIATEYGGNAYEATLYGPRTGANAGKALQSRGHSAWSAVVAVLYKHFTIFDGAAWVVKDRKDMWVN